MPYQQDNADILAYQIKAVKLPKPHREYRFHPTRRWRFDLCWPDKHIAAEVEGGTWVKGRHVRPAQFEKDCIKYNEAALLGFMVLRFTTRMVTTGVAIDTLERALV